MQGFVQSLKILFPAARSAQQQSYAEDVTSLASGPLGQSTLELLREISTGIDPTLCQVAADTLATMPGHRYHNNRAEDEAIIQNGNEYRSDYRGTFSGSHTFNDGLVKGKARMLNGDRVLGPGTKSLFSS